MSYSEALTAAGAVIHDSKWFGSYQGDAVFDVTHEGKRGILVISYGSCGGCDAFESTFGYSDNEACDDHRYDAQADCVLCSAAKDVYQHELAEFGRRYLDNLNTFEDARANASEDLDWDHDAQYVIAYINEREAEAGA